MRYDTKIQSVAGSITTTIPATVRDFLNLSKGESVTWIIDTETGIVSVAKKSWFLFIFFLLKWLIVKLELALANIDDNFLLHVRLFIFV